MPYKCDTEDRVCFYEQEFYVLSNFAAFRLRWQARDFDTSEHAYHWQKFNHTRYPNLHPVRAAIHMARSAHEALKLAHDYRDLIAPDWDRTKVSFMRQILWAKADQHEYVRRKLLETGDRALIEDSWRDSFWGWGEDMRGQNMLGKLWMDIRAELRVRDICSPAAVGQEEE